MTTEPQPTRRGNPYRDLVLPYDQHRDGFCNCCGEAVTEPRRSRWHSWCLDMVLSQMKHPRTICWTRDHGVCVACGTVCAQANWAADHIVRLADGGAYNDPANLQTLCTQCHRTKTIAENTKQEQLP